MDFVVTVAFSPVKLFSYPSTSQLPFCRESYSINPRVRNGFRTSFWTDCKSQRKTLFGLFWFLAMIISSEDLRLNETPFYGRKRGNLGEFSYWRS